MAWAGRDGAGHPSGFLAVGLGQDASLPPGWRAGSDRVLAAGLGPAGGARTSLPSGGDWPDGVFVVGLGPAGGPGPRCRRVAEAGPAATPG